MATAITILACLLFLSKTVAAGPHIEVLPTLLDAGLSEYLEMNCTFDIEDTSDIKSLISLTISRARTSEDVFTDLARIDEVSDQTARKLTSECFTAMGSLELEAESSLSLRWEYPTEDVFGVYKCSAQGSDSLGHLFMLTDVIQVNASRLTDDHWKERVQDMGVHVKSLETMTLQMGIVLKRTVSDVDSFAKKIDQRVIERDNQMNQNLSNVYSHVLDMGNQIFQNDSKLDKNVKSLEESVLNMERQMQGNVSKLDSNFKNLEQSMLNIVSQAKQNYSDLQIYTKSLEEKLLRLEQTLDRVVAYTMAEVFEEPLTYTGHKYYVTREGFANINVSLTKCKLHGGYLVEIDDEEEYQAIVTFLEKAASGYNVVMISGTNQGHDGTWVFQSSNKTLPYVRWHAGRPSTGSYRCVVLYKYNSVWRMFDDPCKRDPAAAWLRYMCEVPQE